MLVVQIGPKQMNVILSEFYYIGSYTPRNNSEVKCQRVALKACSDLFETIEHESSKSLLL